MDQLLSTFYWRRRRAPDVPWDVWPFILAWIPVQYLPGILLTCRAFRRIGEVILYRHINLTNSPIRSLLLCRTIVASPYLAGFVRTHQIAGTVDDPHRFTTLANRMRWMFVSVHYGFSKDLRSVGDKACRNLKNVEAIVIHCPVDQLRTLFPHATRIRLTRNPADADNQLLSSLPNLTHLEMPLISAGAYHSFNQQRIPAHHSPALRELIAPTFVASKLIPRRPVERLFLLITIPGTSPSIVETMTAAQKSTTKIKVMGLVVVGFQWESEAGELLHGVGSFLHNIEELHLCFRFASRTSVTLVTALLDALEDLVAKQPSLRILDLNGCEGQEAVLYLDRDRRALSHCYVDALKRWKTLCPTLTKVVFPNGLIWAWKGGASKWRCQNEWERGEVRLSYNWRRHSDVAEPWSPPMFQKDLERTEWPRDLVAEVLVSD